MVFGNTVFFLPVYLHLNTAENTAMNSALVWRQNGGELQTFLGVGYHTPH
jgi:hypothetical protein